MLWLRDGMEGVKAGAGTGARAAPGVLVLDGRESLRAELGRALAAAAMHRLARGMAGSRRTYKQPVPLRRPGDGNRSWIRVYSMPSR